ncbi:hypothetical protein OJ998_09250 [Solirubrobacter taibaiensis]|nr:hypothetical protein [Solirubrobacter taibaiensis]
MRVAVAVLLFLALAADARADAWIPIPLGDHRVDPLVAADGTSAHVDRYTSPLSLVVHRPGQEPTVIDLSKQAFETDAAVAPGGWAAVAWTDTEGRMQAAVHRPDGTVMRRMLDRDSVSRPVIGIDGTGHTLVGWVGRAGEEDTEWVGRWAGGPGLARQPDLPGAIAVDVAVSASGHRLLAWTTDTGTFARLNDEPAVSLGAAGWDDLVARVNDAGAALVAANVRAEGMSIAERPAGAGWTPLRNRSGGYRILPYLFDDQPQLFAVLAPSGRAAVTWLTRRESGQSFRVAALGGTVGGVWGPATRLSSPVRDAHTATPVLDPAGNPEVVWDEGGVFRAARHDLAALPDTVPLRATAKLSARGTRVIARVRCSKACDAGLSMRDGSSEARAIRANRTSEVRLRIERRRRVRVTLVVADRAGHTQRWTRTLRVR